MISLNEHKNISDDVYQFAVEIYNKILDDADIQQMQKSRVNGFLFVQNTLSLKNTIIPPAFIKHLYKNKRYQFYLSYIHPGLIMSEH